jgi:hypothetical protein
MNNFGVAIIALEGELVGRSRNTISVLLQPENVVLTATRLCHPLSIK